MTEMTTAAQDRHAAPKLPAISFEFFPPKTEEMERSLWTPSTGWQRSHPISYR